jgi:predicted GNAT superfamily acetyltransferase
VAWPSVEAHRPAPPSNEETFTVPTPEDIVVLRRTSPHLAEEWRRRVRLDLGGPLAAGATVCGFTREGDYVVAPA